MTGSHHLVARTAALIAALIGAAMLALTTAPASDAASANRYWGYYQLSDGSWSFAQKGADQMKPADGSVEGWRFALAGQTDTRSPRDTVSFKEICKDTPAKDGTKRVGVVVDFGRSADAASGAPPKPAVACAQTPADASGAEVLAEATGDNVRVEKSMTCGILGWPAKGCGESVSAVPADAKAKDQKVEITSVLGKSGSAAPAVDTKADSPAKAAAADDDDDEGEGDDDDDDEEEEEEGSPVPFVIAGIAIVIVLAATTVLGKRRKDTESV